MQPDFNTLDGKYEILKVLGKGGMSTVYLCRNNRLGNLWAIKEISKEKQKIVNLLAEPNILKNLNHKGIPKVIDVFYENDNMYIVEDYIEGTTLKEYVKKRGRLDESKCLDFSQKLVKIINYLHGLKPPIIYRDLKPSNIMITPEEELVLIDFGISREYKEDREEDTVCLGSKGYAAPEQYGHGQSGKHTDIYGLGAVIYFMALGHTPPSIVTEEAFHACEFKITKPLELMIIKCMEIDRANRYVDSEELEKDIYIIAKARQSQEEIELTKTLFMASAIPSMEISKTKLLYDEVFLTEKTALKNQKKKRASIYLLIGLLVFVIVCTGGYKLWNSLSAGRSVTDKVEAAEDPKEIQRPKESKEQAQLKPVIKKDDINTAGIINLKAPLDLNDNGISEKGKGKRKDKKAEDNIEIYKLNPEAKEAKYTMKFIIRMEYLQVFQDYITSYITIENNTGKNVSIKYDTSTFIQNSKGDKVYAEVKLSDSMNNIPSGTGKRTFRLVFRNLSMDTSYICFNSKLYIEDDSYDSTIKLNVKVVD